MMINKLILIGMVSLIIGCANPTTETITIDNTDTRTQVIVQKEIENGHSSSGAIYYLKSHSVEDIQQTFSEIMGKPITNEQIISIQKLLNYDNQVLYLDYGTIIITFVKRY